MSCDSSSEVLFQYEFIIGDSYDDSDEWGEIIAPSLKVAAKRAFQHLRFDVTSPVWVREPGKPPKKFAIDIEELVSVRELN